MDETTIKKNVKCCVCLGSLESDEWLNIALTNKIATWKFPVASSLCLKNCPHYAIAFVCDNCFRARARIKYADNWQAISGWIKEKAGWHCERCEHEHDPKTGYCLTVHHLDGDKSNNSDWNLATLCQRCHLYMQPVVMDQMLLPFVEVSSWFKPHLDGYLKSKQKQGCVNATRKNNSKVDI